MKAASVHLHRRGQVVSTQEAIPEPEEKPMERRRKFNFFKWSPRTSPKRGPYRQDGRAWSSHDVSGLAPKLSSPFRQKSLPTRLEPMGSSSGKDGTLPHNYIPLYFNKKLIITNPDVDAVSDEDELYTANESFQSAESRPTTPEATLLDSEKVDLAIKEAQLIQPMPLPSANILKSYKVDGIPQLALPSLPKAELLPRAGSESKRKGDDQATKEESVIVKEEVEAAKKEFVIVKEEVEAAKEESKEEVEATKKESVIVKEEVEAAKKETVIPKEEDESTEEESKEEVEATKKESVIPKEDQSTKEEAKVSSSKKKRNRRKKSQASLANVATAPETIVKESQEKESSTVSDSVQDNKEPTSIPKEQETVQHPVEHIKVVRKPTANVPEEEWILYSRPSRPRANSKPEKNIRHPMAKRPSLPNIHHSIRPTDSFFKLPKRPEPMPEPLKAPLSAPLRKSSLSPYAKEFVPTRFVHSDTPIKAPPGFESVQTPPAPSLFASPHAAVPQPSKNVRHAASTSYLRGKTFKESLMSQPPIQAPNSIGNSMHAQREAIHKAAYPVSDVSHPLRHAKSVPGMKSQVRWSDILQDPSAASQPLDVPHRMDSLWKERDETDTNGSWDMQSMFNHRFYHSLALRCYPLEAVDEKAEEDHLDLSQSPTIQSILQEMDTTEKKTLMPDTTWVPSRPSTVYYVKEKDLQFLSQLFIHISQAIHHTYSTDGVILNGRQAATLKRFCNRNGLGQVALETIEQDMTFLTAKEYQRLWKLFHRHSSLCLEY